MSDFDTIKIVQKSIVVPEHISYPSPRINLDSGLLKNKDRVIVQVIVRDSEGNIKFDTSHKIVLKDYPIDSEVIGRISINLIESPISEGKVK